MGRGRARQHCLQRWQAQGQGQLPPAPALAKEQRPVRQRRLPARLRACWQRSRPVRQQAQPRARRAGTRMRAARMPGSLTLILALGSPRGRPTRWERRPQALPRHLLAAGCWPRLRELLQGRLRALRRVRLQGLLAAQRQCWRAPRLERLRRRLAQLRERLQGLRQDRLQCLRTLLRGCWQGHQGERS